MADKDKKQSPKEVVNKKKLNDAPRDRDNLEEGLEESMDASDPPSSTQP